jgi:glutamyl-tRNA synthetase
MNHIRVRFAPSPTGTLHVGGARTAIFNWLYARAQQGVFILRIEDTDQERSTEDSHQQILRAFQWLDLDYDEGPHVGGEFGPYVQSERREIYDDYAQQMLDKGLAYRCYCTPGELEEMRKKAIAEGRQKIHEAPCLNLSAEERAAREAEGRSSVIRVRMPDEGVIKWTDIVHGDTEFECAVLDDWVAVKSDGYPTYNFACVVDDGLMQISHVLRGDDHISNTPRQIHLFKAFGFKLPKFGHLPMILGPDKQRLSKRHGAASVEEFREDGYLPQALVNYLALLGWNPGSAQEVFEMPQLIKAFSLKRLNNTAAVFDPEKCRYINAQHMKNLDDAQRAALVWPRLVRAGLVEDNDEAARAKLKNVVAIMGARISFLGEAAERLACYFSNEFPRDPEAQESLDAAALERLAELGSRIEALGEFSASSLEALMRAYAEELSVKLGELVHPTRAALTGQKVGPSLFASMEVLGRETVVERLRAAKEG